MSGCSKQASLVFGPDLAFAFPPQASRLRKYSCTYNNIFAGPYVSDQMVRPYMVPHTTPHPTLPHAT